jgi:hypothetical protein
MQVKRSSQQYRRAEKLFRRSFCGSWQDVDKGLPTCGYVGAARRREQGWDWLRR